MIPDRSSPSRVRFAASRPGRLRADPKDALFTREKGGTAGRETSLRPRRYHPDLYDGLDPTPAASVLAYTYSCTNATAQGRCGGESAGADMDV